MGWGAYMDLFLVSACNIPELFVAPSGGETPVLASLLACNTVFFTTSYVLGVKREKTPQRKLTKNNKVFRCAK